jgi:glycosyltransferase involved in cell wall biosynthesis
MFVDGGISEGTGYSRRVYFELEIITKQFDVILIYPKQCRVPDDIKFYCKKTIGIEIKKPALLHFIQVTKQLFKIEKAEGKPSLVYGQNLVAAYLASFYVKIKKIPLIFDYHGLVPLEVKGAYKGLSGQFRFIIYKMIEKWTLYHCNRVITVSEKFVQYLNISCNKYTVLPMIPSIRFIDGFHDHRKPINREEIGIAQDSIVFCYLGQAQYWQLPEETIKLYKKFEDKYKNTHLIIITKDTQVFGNLVLKASVSNYTVLSLEHREVPSYLRLCDFGFVLRGPSYVNQVSSPTKVLEYMSQGVVPIMTEYVGDFSQLLHEHQLGIIVPFKGITQKSDIGFVDISNFSKKRSVLAQFVLEYNEKYMSNYTKAIKNEVRFHHL